MGPVEALELALRKEIEAIETYRKLSLEQREVKDTFLFLIGEEEKHKQLLQKKIFEITQ